MKLLALVVLILVAITTNGRNFQYDNSTEDSAHQAQELDEPAIFSDGPDGYELQRVSTNMNTVTLSQDGEGKRRKREAGDIEIKSDSMEVAIKHDRHNITNTLDSILEHLNTGIIKKEFQDYVNASLMEIKSNIEEFQEFNNASLMEIENSIAEFQENNNASLMEIENDIGGLRCPLSDGFFMAPGGHQCFKVISDTTYNWAAGNVKCKAEALQYAEPDDNIALWLRKHIYENYGTAYTWIGAQGNGTYLRWVSDKEPIFSNSSLWWPGHPGSAISTSYCLIYMTSSHINSHPTKPYLSVGCSSRYKILCELVM